MQFSNIQQQEIETGLTHQWVIPGRIKAVVGWFVLILIISGLISFFFKMIDAGVAQPVLKYSYLFFFLITGIAHVIIFPKWLPLLPVGRQIVYTILLSIAIGIMVFLILQLSLHDDTAIAVNAGVVFVLPISIKLCWFYFNGLHAPNAAWYMPAGMVPETRLSVLLLNSIPITILFYTNDKSGMPMEWPITINPRLSMPIVWCRVLLDKQNGLPTLTQTVQQTGWCFYIKRWYGLKPLDVVYSLEENGIKSGDTIVIECRVKSNE